MSEAFNRYEVDAILAPWLNLCKEQEETIAKQRELMRAVVDSGTNYNYLRVVGHDEFDAMQAYLESEDD